MTKGKQKKPGLRLSYYLETLQPNCIYDLIHK
jgi:hypothetical protein